ncbi:hypothetical protein [Bradyrhizobium sp.]
MKFTIIVEWFDTRTELDQMEVAKFRGSLARAKAIARDRLHMDSITAHHIPTVARVEDNDEKVVAVYDWDQFEGRPVLREVTA